MEVAGVRSVKVVEGKTKLFVPDTNGMRHPSHARVFFNPAMKLNRDITVSALSALGVSEFLDAFSATGAKGIRVMNEAGADVTFNDIDPTAIKFVKANLRLNRLSARVENKDANVLMREKRFQAIDIDPFGSVSGYMASAASSVKNRGIICLTDTDTSALSGSYPSSGIRKYGVFTERTSFTHELGIRGLIAFAVREAGKYDIALRPIFVHSTLHYYRVFLEARSSRKGASNAVKSLKWILYDRKTDERGYFEFPCNPSGSKINVGPVWAGEMFDRHLLVRMKGIDNESSKLISLAREEVGFVIPYFDYHILASKHKLPLLKMDKLLNLLSSHGIPASRTHFCSHCFKADAPLSEIISVLKP